MCVFRFPFSILENCETMTEVSERARAVPAKPAATKLAWGYLCAGLGAALFSTKAIFVKFGYAEGLDAATLLAWRMLLSAPIFVVVAVWAWGRKPAGGVKVRTLWIACLVGMIGYYLASWLDFWGLEFISAHLERMILLTYPMFVIFFGALFFKTPIRAHAIGAALFSYAGLAVLVLAGSDMRIGGGRAGVGALLVFGAGISYALYQLFSKDLIGALGSALFTAIAMIGASAAVIAQFVLTHPLSDLALSSKAFWLSVQLALVATVAPVFLMSAGIKYAGPQATAIIGTGSPLITIVLSIWLLHEPFGMVETIGSMLVVGAIGYFTYWDMRRMRTA
jgi:drug/metabolite transporter (DMT)-like permease